MWIKINLNGMKFREKIGFILMLLFIFLFVPFIIIKYQIDTYYLEKRGVSTKATVIKVAGALPNYTYTYRYEVNDEFFERTSPRASKRINVGEQIAIIYDSLDCENSRIIWKKE
jgi:accessory gene regulator protein AgrB